MFRKLDLFPSSGEGAGTYSTKNQNLTLPQAMSDQKKVNHSKQGDYKHLTAGRVRDTSYLLVTSHGLFLLSGAYSPLVSSG
jgi:hypothetical protein